MARLYNGGSWTEGRFRTFIVSGLRAASRKWPPRFQTLNNAKTEKRVNEKTKRLGQHYRCAMCNMDFPASNINVDHISPVVSTDTGFTSWDDFISSLFCEADNLQVVCRPCHSLKTKKERDARKQRTTE